MLFNKETNKKLPSLFLASSFNYIFLLLSYSFLSDNFMTSLLLGLFFVVFFFLFLSLSLLSLFLLHLLKLSLSHSLLNHFFSFHSLDFSIFSLTLFLSTLLSLPAFILSIFSISLLLLICENSTPSLLYLLTHFLLLLLLHNSQQLPSLSICISPSSHYIQTKHLSLSFSLPFLTLSILIWAPPSPFICSSGFIFLNIFFFQFPFKKIMYLLRKCFSKNGYPNFFHFVLRKRKKQNDFSHIDFNKNNTNILWDGGGGGWNLLTFSQKCFYIENNYVNKRCKKINFLR